MRNLRRRIERLAVQRPCELSAICVRAEDPEPGAPAFERRGDIVTLRIGAGVSLDPKTLDLESFFPPGPERDACRKAKVYLGLGPFDLG